MYSNASKILLSPLFLLALILLLLNDFVLKSQFHNFMTGKISDFAGLFVFSLFFIAFLPKRKSIILISIAVLFSFWKSSFSESLINYWNSFEFLTVWRVVDYTDLFALLVLPIAYFYSNYCCKKYEIKLPLKEFATSFVIVVSLFAFIATSEADERSISIGQNYVFRLSKPRFEEILRQNNKIKDLSIKLETDMFPPSNHPNLKTDPRSSFVDFALEYKICNSEFPHVYFSITDLGEMIIIESVSVHTHCQSFAEKNSNAAIKEYESIVKNIFEAEVIEPLKQSAQAKQ